MDVPFLCFTRARQFDSFLFIVRSKSQTRTTLTVSGSIKIIDDKAIESNRHNPDYDFVPHPFDRYQNHGRFFFTPTYKKGPHIFRDHSFTRPSSACSHK